jgi:RNA 3'-terminal phosphate cyclase (ATP)
MSDTLLELDGSFGEGGGQILRTSLSLSLLTGRGFHLRNVRAGRPKPGLQPQHLMSVRAAATIGQAQVNGDSKGSTDLVFKPGKVKPGKYRFDIGTAGATGLVLHTLYLPLMLGADAPSELTLTGGTHVSTSPCFHFLDVTWRAYLAALGMRLRLEMVRPGFYPRGGGEVRVFLQPCKEVGTLKLLQRGQVKVTGFSAIAELPDQVAKRQARRARYRLEQQGLDLNIAEETWENGPGSVLALTLDTSPAPTLFFALGERGKPSEKVADEAVEQVLAYRWAGESAAIDPHSADQIVLPLALARGRSEFTTSEITRHVTTNVAVIRRFLDREIVCEGEEGHPGRVRVS